MISNISFHGTYQHVISHPDMHPVKLFEAGKLHFDFGDETSRVKEIKVNKNHDNLSKYGTNKWNSPQDFYIDIKYESDIDHSVEDCEKTLIAAFNKAFEENGMDPKIDCFMSSSMAMYNGLYYEDFAGYKSSLADAYTCKICEQIKVPSVELNHPVLPLSNLRDERTASQIINCLCKMKIESYDDIHLENESDVHIEYAGKLFLRETHNYRVGTSNPKDPSVRFTYTLGNPIFYPDTIAREDFMHNCSIEFLELYDKAHEELEQREIAACTQVRNEWWREAVSKADHDYEGEYLGFTIDQNEANSNSKVTEPDANWEYYPDEWKDVYENDTEIE